jgi:hypothetical protein
MLSISHICTTSEILNMSNVRITAKSSNIDLAKTKLLIEYTEMAFKNGQSRETGNIGYTRLRQTKQKHKTICVGHHHM